MKTQVVLSVLEINNKFPITPKSCRITVWINVLENMFNYDEDIIQQSTYKIMLITTVLSVYIEEFSSSGSLTLLY